MAQAVRVRVSPSAPYREYENEQASIGNPLLAFCRNGRVVFLTIYLIFFRAKSNLFCIAKYRESRKLSSYSVVHFCGHLSRRCAPSVRAIAGTL